MIGVYAITLSIFYFLFLLIIWFVMKFICISNVFFIFIITFMQLCSNDVCQLHIFYVSHSNISILFKYFYLLYIFFSHENV